MKQDGRSATENKRRRKPARQEETESSTLAKEIQKKKSLQSPHEPNSKLGQLTIFGEATWSFNRGPSVTLEQHALLPSSPLPCIRFFSPQSFFINIAPVSTPRSPLPGSPSFINGRRIHLNRRPVIFEDPIQRRLLNSNKGVFSLAFHCFISCFALSLMSERMKENISR